MSDVVSSGAVQQRYSALAQQSGSLSCGAAGRFCSPSPGEVCVDLGCGKGGDVLRLAARVGPGGRAIGIDATPAMLEVARQRALDAGLGNAAFIEGPLEALPLEDGLADQVVSNCALNHAGDKGRAWREIARVLKPGGRFVVSDIYAVEPVAEEDRRDPVAVAECWAGAESRAETLAHVSRAGLVDVEVLEERQPYRRGRALLASFTLSGRRPTPAHPGAEPTKEEVIR